jgi:hypothetical protein
MIENNDLDHIIVESLYSQKNDILRDIASENARLISQFTFVDLAGSEKLEKESDP